MIPASGEFTYATQGIRKGTDGGASEPENLNALTDTADMVVALDRLQAMAPKVESVSSWWPGSATICARALQGAAGRRGRPNRPRPPAGR
jgi:hypothetical protein